MTYEYEQYLAHYGIKGQKWGVRRFQNEDGTLTAEGKKRYGESDTWKKEDASTLSDEELNRRNSRMQRELQYKQGINNRHPARKEALDTGKKIFVTTAVGAGSALMAKKYKDYLDKKFGEKVKETAEKTVEKATKNVVEETAKKGAEDASKKIIEDAAIRAAQNAGSEKAARKAAEKAAKRASESIAKGKAAENIGREAASKYTSEAAKVTTATAKRSVSSGRTFLYNNRRLLGLGAGVITYKGTEYWKKKNDEAGRDPTFSDFAYRHRGALGVAAYVAVNKIAKHLYTH